MASTASPSTKVREVWPPKCFILIHASKAGFTNYLEGLALALKPHGIYITNVRFGFVDTKMAKSDFKPLMMSVKKAVDHLESCISINPVSYTAPKMAIPLIKFRKLMMRLGAR